MQHYRLDRYDSKLLLFTLPKVTYFALVTLACIFFLFFSHLMKLDQHVFAKVFLTFYNINH